MPVPAPILTLIVDGDFVNGAKEITNEAINAIPVAYTLDSQGQLTITCFGGYQYVVPFHQVYAKLGTIFQDLLPSTATPDEPGIVKIAPSGDISNLDSNTTVPTVAATVELINALAQTSLLGWDSVLNSDAIGSNTAQGEAWLKYRGLIPPAYVLAGKTTLGAEIEVARFTLRAGNVVAFTYLGGDAITYDASTFRVNLDYAIFKGKAKADSVHIANPKQVQNATKVFVPTYNNSTQGDEVCEISLADFRRSLNVIPNDGTGDLWVNTAIIKNADSITNPALFWVGRVTPTGIELVLAQDEQVALRLAPILKPLLGTGSGGTSDGLTTVFKGCRLEDIPPDNEKGYVLDSVARGTWQNHNFQTADVGLKDAYYYNSTDSRWYKDTDIDSYLQINSTQFRVKANAPLDYDTRKVKLTFERINKI